MYSTSCYKELLNFENTLYLQNIMDCIGNILKHSRH
jgi:hypothetical protein